MSTLINPNLYRIISIPICLLLLLTTLVDNSLANEAITNKKGQYKTVEWTELMPKDDLNALMNPPSYVTDVEDGALEDQISSQIQSAIASANNDSYQQALSSTRVID